MVYGVKHTVNPTVNSNCIICFIYLSRHENTPAMTSAKPKPRTNRRAMPKQARREQLIKATIKCIAGNGLSATTMADITREAGLSMGIVNLHFESKEKLLVETLRSVTGEYKEGLDKIFNDPDKSAVEKLAAHIEYDFSKNILNRNKLAVWFAFWGEAKSRPTYSKIFAKHDKALAGNLTKLFEAVIKDGQYKRFNAERISTAYRALADGLWLNILVTPKDATPKQARLIGMDYLATLFPKHFR